MLELVIPSSSSDSERVPNVPWIVRFSSVQPPFSKTSPSSASIPPTENSIVSSAFVPSGSVAKNIFGLYPYVPSDVVPEPISSPSIFALTVNPSGASPFVKVIVP